MELTMINNTSVASMATDSDTHVAHDAHVPNEAAEPGRREPLLTYDQLAADLDIPLGTLFAWVSNREIPHLRLGPRTVRFRRSEIENWLKERAVPAAPEGRR